jgi:hypothetical protein
MDHDGTSPDQLKLGILVKITARMAMLAAMRTHNMMRRRTIDLPVAALVLPGSSGSGLWLGGMRVCSLKAVVAFLP